MGAVYGTDLDGIGSGALAGLRAGARGDVVLQRRENEHRVLARGAGGRVDRSGAVRARLGDERRACSASMKLYRRCVQKAFL